MIETQSVSETSVFSTVARLKAQDDFSAYSSVVYTLDVRQANRVSIVDDRELTRTKIHFPASEVDGQTHSYSLEDSEGFLKINTEISMKQQYCTV
jgi:hypothetical protein